MQTLSDDCANIFFSMFREAVLHTILNGVPYIKIRKYIALTASWSNQNRSLLFYITEANLR